MVRDLLVRYIDALIPLTVGVFVSLFPQALTKVDLAHPENKKTADKFRIAGAVLLVAALIAFVTSTLQAGTE